MITKFTVIDTETTGPDPERDRVIQIGAAVFTDGVCTSAKSVLVKPEGNVFVPRGAYEVHDISHVDLRPERSFAEAWAELAVTGLTVGYNSASFDVPLLTREAKASGVECDLSRHVDLYPYVAWHFRGFRKRKLGDACAFFGIRIEAGDALHDAISDCKITGRLMTRLLAVGVVPAEEGPAMARQRLLAAALAEESARYSYWFYEDRLTGDLRMGCGRHTGKLIAEVPKKEWIRLASQVKDAPESIMNMIREFAK
jgi:DNA polymerase III epsilon subunit-like protein